jgi:hypothetical protein
LGNANGIELKQVPEDEANEGSATAQADTKRMVFALFKICLALQKCICCRQSREIPWVYTTSGAALSAGSVFAKI